jgi:uncharacterized membrane protein
MWFDLHSTSFAAGFIAWFIYFLDSKKYKTAWVFLFLAVTAKENMGVFTALIGVYYYWKYKDKQIIWMSVLSFSYVLLIYFVFFPYIIHHAYLYQNKAGLLSNLNPVSLIDTEDKRQALFYSFASFGFLPLAIPLSLLPTLGHFFTDFVIASELTAAHGIFMHYRVTLAPLLIWSTILTIAKYKRLNNLYIAVYLIICALIVQYALHLPLSYLTKTWFWTKPSGVDNINELRKSIPQNSSVVTQNNIVPHMSKRDGIYSLYPERKQFRSNSPCGSSQCNWFRWDNHPAYLFVDTSPEWDSRHLLTNRDEFIDGIHNLEKAHVIKKQKQLGTATIYKVLKNPDSF